MRPSIIGTESTEESFDKRSGMLEAIVDRDDSISTRLNIHRSAPISLKIASISCRSKNRSVPQISIWPKWNPGSPSAGDEIFVSSRTASAISDSISALWSSKYRDFQSFGSPAAATSSSQAERSRSEVRSDVKFTVLERIAWARRDAESPDISSYFHRFINSSQTSVAAAQMGSIFERSPMRPFQ